MDFIDVRRCIVVRLFSSKEVTIEEPQAGEKLLDFGPGANALAGGSIGGVAGFVIGGAVGASSKKEKVYDFSQQTREQKITALHGLITE